MTSCTHYPRELQPDRAEDERRLVEAYRRLPLPVRDALLRDAEFQSFNFARKERDHG